MTNYQSTLEDFLHHNTPRVTVAQKEESILVSLDDAVFENKMTKSTTESISTAVSYTDNSPVGHQRSVSDCTVLHAESVSSCAASPARSLSNGSLNGQHASTSKISCMAASRVLPHVSIENRYNLNVRLLGEGASGSVSVAKNKLTGQEVAVKFLPLDEKDEKQTASSLNEMKILLQLDHPNICKLLEVYEDSANIKVVMECCSGADLYTALAEKVCYSANVTKRLARQMFDAISYCHAHGICHRDLKLENWVYADASRTQIKLIDFGFSAEFDDQNRMTARHGTVYYVAPEVLTGTYDEKCDVWSLGVICFMMLSGTPPFDDANQDDKAILRKVQKANYSFSGPAWRTISPFAKDFIRLLLTADPAKRISAQDALRHAWISPNNNSPTSISSGASIAVNTAMLQRMRWFTNQPMLKRACFGMLTYSVANQSLGTTAISDLRQQFDLFQDEGDYRGIASKKKLSNILRVYLNISESDAREIIDTIDQQGNDQISFCEFLAPHLDPFVQNDAIVRDVFDKLDHHNAGFLTTDALKYTFGQSYCGRNVSNMISEVTRSPVLDYETFRRLLQGISLPSADVVAKQSPQWKGTTVGEEISEEHFRLSPRVVPCRS